MCVCMGVHTSVSGRRTGLLIKYEGSIFLKKFSLASTLLLLVCTITGQFISKDPAPDSVQPSG